MKPQIRKNNRKQLGREVILRAPAVAPAIENPRLCQCQLLGDFGLVFIFSEDVPGATLVGFFFNIYSFIWLHQVLVAACGI